MGNLTRFFVVTLCYFAASNQRHRVKGGVVSSGEEGDVFHLIDRIWIELVHPRSRDQYLELQEIPIVVAVNVEARLLDFINGTILRVPASVDKIEHYLDIPVWNFDNDASLGGEIKHWIQPFCTTTKLHENNCNAVSQKLADTLAQFYELFGGTDASIYAVPPAGATAPHQPPQPHAAAPGGPLAGLTVCLELDGAGAGCLPAAGAAAAFPPLRGLPPGRHSLRAELRRRGGGDGEEEGPPSPLGSGGGGGGGGDVIAPAALARFDVRPPCSWRLSVESPLEGSLQPNGRINVMLELHQMEDQVENDFSLDFESSLLCLSVEDGPQHEQTEACYNMSEALINTSGGGGAPTFYLGVEGLPPGRRQLRLWVAAEATHGRLTQVCGAGVGFEVSARGRWRGLGGPHGHHPVADLTVVTAASQGYFADKRLHNMIGSVHFWEPSMKVIFYDLNLSAPARAEVARWRGVEIRSLPPGLPNHMYQASSYAFKPWVIADALLSHRNVVWIDANVELRRPLDEMRDELYMKGHLFMTHPAGYPNPQYHFPAQAARLGCRAPDRSRRHCATTVMAFARGAWAHRELLLPLVDCALEDECINPVGSSRINHRQEQSALNAIMCRLDVEVCSEDEKWSLQSFHNDIYLTDVTLCETDWNSVVFYTRRTHPIKPYLPFLEYNSSINSIHDFE